MFFHTALELGLSRAKQLAAKFHWEYERPLAVLLAASNQSGRSYPKRSANTRGLPRSADSRRRHAGASPA
jgi:hypothetical protein